MGGVGVMQFGGVGRGPRGLPQLRRACRGFKGSYAFDVVDEARCCFVEVHVSAQQHEGAMVAAGQ